MDDESLDDLLRKEGIDPNNFFGDEENLEDTPLEEQEEPDHVDSSAGGAGIYAFSSESSVVGHGVASASGGSKKRPFSSTKEFLKPMDFDEPKNHSAAKTDFDFHVQNCCLKLARENTVKMPWEEPFGRPSAFAMLQPPKFDNSMISRYTFQSLPSTSVERTCEPLTWASESPFQSRRLLAARFARTDDDLRDMALSKLRTIVLYDPMDSQLGKSLLKVAGMLVPEAEVMMSFTDCFSAKSTGTLVKRANDFNKFAVWQIGVNGGRPLNPSESDLYKYLNHLRDTGAAPTAGSSFIKAWNFIRFSVGVTSSNAADTMSGRVQGIAKSMFLKKRPLKQAAPLTADLVWQLERLMFSDELSEAHIAILGFLLFCLFSSSRFADAARARRIGLESSGHMFLLESQTGQYKTALTQEKRTTMLPLIALGTALYNVPWGPRWMEARAVAGLADFECLMPALNESTWQWIPRPMTTAEGCYWLRDFIYQAGVSEKEAMGYSCHSLKATALSWVFKAGVMTSLERKIMGHHWDAENAMPLTYSRDALADIMVKLYRVVKAIQQGHFDPDASRAARVAAATGGSIQLQQNVLDEEDADPPQEGPEHESDLDEDESEPIGETVPLPQVGQHERPGFPDVDLQNCKQHRLSGIVHLLETDTSFLCGRPISLNYVDPAFTRAEMKDQNFCENCHRVLVTPH